MSSHIDAADLNQRVGEILSKVRESRERYVIEEKGTPIAAVVSMDDLARLEETTSRPKPSVAEALAALDRARAVRKMIRRSRGNRKPTDSVRTIRYLRETRGSKFIKRRKRAKTNLR